jgi:hypothetical protein
MKLPKRRILMTHWIRNAVETLYRDYQDVIINSFPKVGLSLNPDSSEDHEIKIRDLPEIDVGDWQREPSLDTEVIGFTPPRFYATLLYTFINRSANARISSLSTFLAFPIQLPAPSFTIHSPQLYSRASQYLYFLGGG